MFNIMEIKNMNNRNEIRFKINAKPSFKYNARVKRARIRALKYCFLTTLIGIFFTVPLFLVVHGLV